MTNRFFLAVAATIAAATILAGSAAANSAATVDVSAAYIVHAAPSGDLAALSTPLHWYTHTLRSLPAHLRRPAPSILYAYSRATHGFAARLTAAQAAALRRSPSILAVIPDGVRHPHTTHTPAFLHLSNTSGLWPNSDYASDVVVGVLDTGVWPHNHPSFSDDDLSPPPSSFKGPCETGPGFPASFCNRKLIGARFFSKGYESSMGPIDESKESKSPLDTEGHGTHTSSTAAGAVVPDAGFFTYAKGIARGMAAKARIAAYKICWASGCFDSDILAAFDAAIDDGVDVISLSVGSSGYAPSFYRDSIAIGAFGAARHGVVVSCSAGNSGPGAYTAVNIAPWILTVGASTVDREFPADVLLGDGSVHGGVSLYAGEPLDSTTLFPLAYGADCGSQLCQIGQLDPAKVAGKVIVCDRGGNARVEKGSAVKLAGGVGMIMANTAASGEELLADSHLIAATMVGETAGNKIRNYIKTTASPTANIVFRGTVVGPSPASPKVASFSSRGPNYRAPEILKPDVIAPGVNILAGWTGAIGPTDLESDPRRVPFNIISGTSMSCPHVSGLAALLRKAHPEWTPAAIKSALMTTAYNVDNSGEIIGDLATGGQSTPFIRGAGHVDPNGALDPGLVYDLQIDDYIGFLCTLAYGPSEIAVFTRGDITVNCSALALPRSGDLNYPAFAVVFNGDKEVVKYKRVVKNVGETAAAVYEAAVSAPAGVSVTVEPSKLVFEKKDQSLSYEITFESSEAKVSHSFGSIAWSDGKHKVTSPIAISWRQGYAASI